MSVLWDYVLSCLHYLCNHMHVKTDTIFAYIGRYYNALGVKTIIFHYGTKKHSLMIPLDMRIIMKLLCSVWI